MLFIVLRSTAFFIVSLFVVLPLFSIAQTTTDATTTSETTSASTTPPLLPPPPVIDSRQAALQPVAQTRITNLAANLSNRLDASVRRLTNVAGRLEQRIQKMEAEGFTVTEARNSHRAALAQLQVATISLQTIDAEVAAFVGSSDPLTAWVRLENIYGTIGTQVITAHTALRESVQTLESASLPPTAPASTTTSTLPE